MTEAKEPDMTKPTSIRLRGVEKTFGSSTAVAGGDLTVADGEFFAMLGPSGSGKTTMLRMIAGFERPTAGTIELAGDFHRTRPRPSAPESSFTTNNPSS